MRPTITKICAAFLAAAVAIAAVSCGPETKPETPTTKDDRSAALGFMRTGDKYMASKQYALAYGMYCDAVKSDPALFEAHLGRQESFFKYFDAAIPGQVRQRKQLVKEYGDYLGSYGNSAEFRFLYGNVLDKSGQRTKAAGYLRRAIEIDPTFYRALLVLADICEEVERSPRQAANHRAEGRKFRLVSDLKSDIDKNPYGIVAHLRYQDVVFKMENVMPERFPVGGLENRYASLAQRHIGTAHEATFRYLWGRVLGMVGKPDEAKMQFEHARSLNPKMGWAHDGLATCLLQKIRGGALTQNEQLVEKAVRLLIDATSFDPSQAAIGLKLIKARQIALNVYASQLANLERQIKNEPNNERLNEYTERMNHYFIKIHDTRRACHNELLGITSKHPENIEGYVLLTTIALTDGAFLFAQRAINIADARARALSDEEAEKTADIVREIAPLKAKTDTLAASLTKNRKMAMGYVPVIFFFEEISARLESKDAELRKDSIALAMYAAIGLQGQIAGMPQAMQADLQNNLKHTVAIIVFALKDKDSGVQLEAVRAAGRLRLTTFADVVAAIMKDPQADPQLSMACVEALYAMRVKQAFPALIGGLKSENASVRKTCIDALQDLAGRNHGFYSDDDEVKRKAAIEKWEQWWAEHAETFEIKGE